MTEKELDEALRKFETAVTWRVAALLCALVLLVLLCALALLGGLLWIWLYGGLK